MRVSNGDRTPRRTACRLVCESGAFHHRRPLGGAVPAWYAMARSGPGRRSQPRHCRLALSAASSPIPGSPPTDSRPDSLADRRLRSALHRERVAAPLMPPSFRTPRRSSVSRVRPSRAPSRCRSRGHATGLSGFNSVPKSLNIHTVFRKPSEVCGGERERGGGTQGAQYERRVGDLWTRAPAHERRL